MPCLAVAGAAWILASPVFILGWTHSVEKTGWQETWEIGAEGLTLTEARVRGSGAGMDPGDGARLEDGWWVWEPRLTVPELMLAASGATVSGWDLCSGGECRELGHDPAAAITLAPCS
jgi:hypothetical protein